MAIAWKKPDCPVCAATWRRGADLRGIYDQCSKCEATEAVRAAKLKDEAAGEQARLDWLRTRRRERGRELAHDLGEEGPMP